ncbi:MAG: hypothetical protein COB35_10025 [Gammaproteobacteria bacterium]|nr:MAG: hypothetical protein COB35_10025 [Gammaproteobacteria bacterium]
MFIIKRLAKIALISVVASSTIFTQAAAEQNGAKVEIKCWVELYGGKDIIHFANINLQNLNGYGNYLVGRKVKTAFRKEKLKVYKVKECVKLNEKFSSDRGRQVDENSIR